jgi:hypothetical protein
MKRFRRRLLYFCAATSALLCAAWLWFWFTSYLLGWQCSWEHSHADGLGISRFEIEISGGGFSIHESNYRDVPGIYQSLPWYRALASPAPDPLRVGRLAVSDYPDSLFSPSPRRWTVVWLKYAQGLGVMRNRQIVAPCWFIFLLLAAVPAFAAARAFRHKPEPGICSKCGYDLRATPDRCPECGTIPVKTEIISN